MDTLIVRKELHNYIDGADDDTVRAMYQNINVEDSQPYEWWKDEELNNELDKIAADMESGKDAGATLDQVNEHLLKRLEQKFPQHSELSDHDVIKCSARF